MAGRDTLDCVSAGMLSLFGCADAAAFSELTGDTFTGLVHVPKQQQRRDAYNAECPRDIGVLRHV